MRLIVSIFCLFLVSISFAQEGVKIRLHAEKHELEIGEPLSVSLTIEFPAEKSNLQLILPVVTDSSKLGNGIEIWETSAPTDTLIENLDGTYTKHFEQWFTVASFDTGSVDINPLKAIFGKDTVYSNSLSLTINTVKLDQQAQLKNIKPIIEDPLTIWEEISIWIREHWILISALLLLPLITYIIYRYYMNKPIEIETKEIIPLNVRSLELLAKIEEEQIWKTGAFKQYYSEVTGVLWMYLSERYQIATLEKTSNEILKQLKFKAVPNDQYVQLQKLMQLADLVKFAKTIPTAAENESVLTIAKEFIHTTYETQYKTTKE